MMNLLKQLLDYLVNFVKTEPAVVTGIVVSVVVALAGAFGVVLDVQSVTSIVAQLIVILTGALVVRSHVTPV